MYQILIEKVDFDSFLSLANAGPAHTLSGRESSSPRCVSASGLTGVDANRKPPACRRGGRRADKRRAVPECCAPLLERSRLSAHRPAAIFHPGAVLLRAWPDEPRPSLSRRLWPAFDQAIVQQVYLQPLIVGADGQPRASRCLRARQTAGAAPCSAIKNASGRRPSVSKVVGL